MDQTALVRAWTPSATLSPLLLDAWELGDSYITRKVGQDGYSLNSIHQGGPLSFSDIEAAKVAGARIEAGAFARKLKDRQDEPFEDVAECNEDVTVSDQGSIVLFRPRTDAARDWIDANVQDDALWFGGALAVEHRYAPYLIEGLLGDGLKTASAN